MKALNVFLAILVSLALGLLILEGGLRLLGRGPAPEAPVEFDAVTGWSKKPGFRQSKRSAEFDIEIEFNELGLRDDPMASPAKPDGVFRVLALGDSFVQGFTVDREDLFVDLLEGYWQSEGRPIEVINAGTEAWDTAQQAAWLEANAEAYEPDLVLVFPYENDLYWNSQASYFSSSGPLAKPLFEPDGSAREVALEEPEPKPWHQRFAITKWLGSRPRGGAAHAFVPQGAAGATTKEVLPLVRPEPAEMAGVRAHTLGALRAIDGAAQRAGAEVVVVPIPAATKYDEDWAAKYEAAPKDGGRGLAGVDWDPDRPIDLFLELADEAGLATLDPRPALDAAAADDAPLYYSAGVDWHFNPRGNRVFAEFVHDALESEPAANALPEPEREGTLASVRAEPEGGGLPFWLKLYLGLFVVATGGYYLTYPDEPKWQPPLKVGGLLAVVFAIFMGVKAAHDALPPEQAVWLRTGFVVLVLGVVVYYLGSKILTIGELIRSFILRGHWYLMPLLVVLLTIGSLLVVAASNPFVAPFIYTLF